MILFAIYKNGFHKGNERAINGNEAKKNYIVASDLSDFLDDDDFLNQYVVKVALEGFHYNENTVL